jgi:hypothetical protein
METTRSLPPSVERKHIHSRHVESHGFLRADGLWDIEARIKDTKTYFTRNADGRERQPGEALHHMEVRLTLDDTLKVFNAIAIIAGSPFVSSWRSHLEDRRSSGKDGVHLSS